MLDLRQLRLRPIFVAFEGHLSSTFPPSRLPAFPLPVSRFPLPASRPPPTASESLPPASSQ